MFHVNTFENKRFNTSPVLNANRVPGNRRQRTYSSMKETGCNVKGVV